MTRLNRHELTGTDWIAVVKKLKELDVGFLAIYGAEPTLKMDELCMLIGAAKNNNIACTVISNSISLSDDKLLKLSTAGLESITISMNNPNGTSLRDVATMNLLKSGKLDELFDDIEVSFTVSDQNWQTFLNYLETDLAKKYWTSFDLLHHDRGNFETKCSGKSTPDFAFLPEFKERLLELKAKTRARIHQSVESIKMLEPTLSWKCRPVPSFLTVDCNGELMACDDCACIGNHNLLDPDFNLKAFMEDRAETVKTLCQGCCWTTHFMSDEMVNSKDGLKYFKHEV